MKVMLCPNLLKKNALKCTLDVCDILHEQGILICIDSNYFTEFSCKKYLLFGNFTEQLLSCDMVIAIGGDGTILHCARDMADICKPLLGINTGRLGFMASIETDNLELLNNLKIGEYIIEPRMMLDAKHISNEKVSTFTALNDIVIARPYSKISEFQISVDNGVISNMRADGLVFSTPTGSTAYSLSAGGPIIEPDVECIEFTPICAHSLFSRTILLSPNKKISVVHKNENNSDVYFSYDGSDSIGLGLDDELIISKSDRVVNLVKFSCNNFYSSVNKKLSR